MLMKALYDLAESEQLVPDPDFEIKPIAYLVRVAEDGRCLGIESTKETPAAERKKKPKPVAKAFRVPRESGRTSGDKAFFLIDKAEYLFGVDPSGAREAEKLLARAALFRERVAACVAVADDAGAKAVLRFLNDLAEGHQSVVLPKDCVSNDLFAFVYAPDVDRLVTERPTVMEYWRSQRAQHTQGDAVCMVTGLACTPTNKHPPLKKVPGGSTSGIALVSFNSNAFESYGWKGNANAPVSRKAAEACATALNRLLDPDPPDPNCPGAKLPRRNLRIGGDTVVCYWSNVSKGNGFLDALSGLMESNEETVSDLYRGLWRGKLPPSYDRSLFFALMLSGTQGRAVIRGWFQTTIADAEKCLAQYFKDLELCRNTLKPRERPLPSALSLRTLVESVTPKGTSAEVSPAIEVGLVRAAFAGAPFPELALQCALQRTRAEIGDAEWSDYVRRDARAALIKAVLNSRKRFHPETTSHYQEVKPNMDPANKNPGYLLGRLMAILERLQQAVMHDVNASVVDRFFSNASAAPRTVFVRLLKLARHHARKASTDDDRRVRGLAIRLEKEMDDILANFQPGNEGIPAVLPLEEQGMFVLGYHQQRHELFRKKEEREQDAREMEK